MLFGAPGALFLKIRENCHGNCLGSRAPSFQNDGLQGSSDPPPLGSLIKQGRKHLKVMIGARIEDFNAMELRFTKLGLNIPWPFQRPTLGPK